MEPVVGHRVTSKLPVNLLYRLIPQATSGADFSRAVAAREEALRFEATSQFRAAAKSYRVALHCLQSLGGSADLAWAVCARDLSLLYLKHDCPRRSRWYARLAVRAALRQGEDRLETLRTLAFYGSLLLRLGCYGAAGHYLKRAYRMRKRASSSDPSFFADVADLLVDLHRAENRMRRANLCGRLSRRLRYSLSQQIEVTHVPRAA